MDAYHESTIPPLFALLDTDTKSHPIPPHPHGPAADRHGLLARSPVDDLDGKVDTDTKSHPTPSPWPMLAHRSMIWTAR